MSSKRERHQQRLADVNALGKVLTRRARSKCELCEEEGRLKVVEVPPVEEEPGVEAAILACPRCVDLVEGKGRQSADELRFLENAVWADPTPVKVASVRMVRGLSDRGVHWATDLLDGLWLPDEIVSLLGDN